MQRLLDLLQYYKDAIHVIRDDLSILQQSFEESEVVTDESIFLRSSVDRLSVDRLSVDGKEKTRRRSSASQPAPTPASTEPKKRIFSQFRFSYVIDACTLQLRLGRTDYRLLLQRSAAYADATELQLDCDAFAFSREGEDALEMVRCDEKAFSAVVSLLATTECSVAVTNCQVVVDMAAVKRLADETLCFLNAFHLPVSLAKALSGEEPSGERPSGEEPSRLKALITVRHATLQYRYAPAVGDWRGLDRRSSTA